MINKNKILQAAIRKQQSLIDDFQTRIRNLLANEGNVNEESYDSQSQAQLAQTSEHIDQLSRQLAFAESEMRQLNEMSSYTELTHDRAERGAIVMTDKGNFYISVSLEQFDADGIPLTGISTSAPLFDAMRGKKVKDTFTFRDTVYTIRKIY